MEKRKVQPVIFDYEELRKEIIKKRLIDNRLSIRKAAKQIDISASTLSRVECGKKFDMDTFCKILRWLVHSPEEYFIHPKQ